MAEDVHGAADELSRQAHRLSDDVHRLVQDILAARADEAGPPAA